MRAQREVAAFSNRNRWRNHDRYPTLETQRAGRSSENARRDDVPADVYKRQLIGTVVSNLGWATGAHFIAVPLYALVIVVTLVFWKKVK